MHITTNSRCLAITAAVSLTLSAMPAYSATLYWDDDDTGVNAQGGTGTWDTSTSNWDTAPFGGSDTTWTNGSNTAVFGGGGTASRTVTLGENITVGGLQFDARTYTISTGANTLTFGATDNLILFGGNRDTTAAGITGTVAGTGNLILSQRILPLGSTFTFSGISTGGWSGSTTINAGTTLVTTSTSGNINKVLNSTSGITLNGGAIQFNRGTNANINAISDSAAITVNGGGTFGVTSADAGGASAIENIGAVTVNSGQMNFNFTNNASSGQQVVMSGLTRAGSTSALTFSGNSLSSSNKFIVTGAGTTSAGEIIGPWATTGPQNGVNVQTDYAVFNSNEVHAANIAGSAQSTWSTVHAATSNYTLANAAGSVSDGVLSATRNINSLRNATTAAATSNTGAPAGFTNGVNTTTEYFHLPGNSFADGDLITVSNTQGTAAGVPYYVKNAGGAGAGTFQISTTPGGAAVNLTNTTAGQISGGLNLNGNKLGTYGILNGTANANSGFAIAGSGNVTLPTTTSGNLFVSTSASAMTINSVIADNGAGVLTLVKNGGNTLTLGATNTYTGDLVINAGTLTLSNVGAWGPTGKNVTFAGSGTLNPVGTYTGGVLTLTEGAVGTIGRGTGTPATSFASTTGSGKLIFLGTGNSGVGLNLGNASGFTGDIEANISGGTNPRPLIIFSSLGDAAGSALQFGGGNGDSGQSGWFRYSGTSSLTFDNRQIELLPRSANNNGPKNLYLQNNSAGGNLWVINTDFVNNGDRGQQALFLDGTNTGDNEFAGDIGDSTYNGAAFNVYKTGTGKWILSGDNTFTGAVIANQGTLSVGTFNEAGVAGPLGAGSVIQLGGREDRVGGSGLSLGTGNSGTLEYTGGAVTSTRQFFIGDTGAATTGGGGISNNGTGALVFSNATFNPTQTGITATRTLTLGGTNTDANQVQGTIQDNVASTGKINLAKSNSGKWILSGANTYTGTTTINGGVLQFAKQVSLYNNTPASWTKTNIIVNSGGTLALNVGGTGEFNNSDVTTLLGNLAVSISNNGLRSGSTLGFDTTNAGGTFTIGDVLANSTGTGSGAVGLLKLGTGALVLSNTNTYTGATTVDAGTLVVTGSLASGSAVTVDTDAALGGTGVIGGSVAANGTLAPGLSPGTLTINGATTMVPTTILAFELDNTDTTEGGGINDLLTLADLTLDGTLNVTSGPLGAGTWRLIDYSGSLTNNTLDIGSINLAAGHTASIDLSQANQVNLVVVVPEPASLALLGLGGLMLGRRRR